MFFFYVTQQDTKSLFLYRWMLLKWVPQGKTNIQYCQLWSESLHRDWTYTYTQWSKKKKTNKQMSTDLDTLRCSHFFENILFFTSGKVCMPLNKQWTGLWCYSEQSSWTDRLPWVHVWWTCAYYGLRFIFMLTGMECELLLLKQISPNFNSV